MNCIHQEKRIELNYLISAKLDVFAVEVFENPSTIVSSDLDVQQIQQLIDGLPEGYRMVFVMYAIEGYKHQEIAKVLNISEGTSKSQLFKARKLLQEQLRTLNNQSHGTAKI